MSFEHLPRPWLLAALSGVSIDDLVDHEEACAVRQLWRRRPAMPRPEERRRRSTAVRPDTRQAGNDRRWRD